MAEKTVHQKVGVIAALCLKMVLFFGQWQFTYGAGLLGAFLSCLPASQTHKLWPATMGAVAACIADSEPVAHAAAVVLVVSSIVSHFTTLHAVSYSIKRQAGRQS